MTRQLEKRTVPGHQQVGVRSERKLEEFLVVAIAAHGKFRASLGRQRFIDEAREAAATREARGTGRFVERAPAERVRQHPGELRLAGRVDHDLGALRRRPER